MPDELMPNCPEGFEKYLSLAVGQQFTKHLALKLMMKNTYNNINATIMPVQNCDFQHETKAVASRPC